MPYSCLQQSMPCLQFFLCTHCETVYADLDEPPRCDVCNEHSFEELRTETQAKAYFAGRSMSKQR